MAKAPHSEYRSNVRVHFKGGGFITKDFWVDKMKVSKIMERTADANGWLDLLGGCVGRDYLIPKENILYIEVLDTTGSILEFDG